MRRRFLIVSEAFSLRSSGGRAALAIAEGLRELGAEVRVATFSSPGNCQDRLQRAFGVTFLSHGAEWRQRMRQFIPLDCMGPYRALLDEFRPEVVHFASFEYGKSRFLITAAKSAGASVVLQPWTYSTICSQGYGYRGGGPCDACFKGDFGNAARLGCLTGLRAHFHGASRRALRRTALEDTDWYFSTCVDMDERLVAYGANRARIVRIPLPFHPAGLEKLTATYGDAFAFHGQFKDFKGIQLLPQLCGKCPDVNFVLFPFDGETAPLSEFGVIPERFPNLRVTNGLGWGSGLAEELARARGLLLTTLWPSSTEYALVEGLSMAKPVMAFAVGAHRDLLKDEVNAMVAPVGDVDGLATRIRRVNADPALRASIGHAGRTLYDQVWEPTAWHRHLAAAYHRIGIKFG